MDFIAVFDNKSFIETVKTYADLVFNYLETLPAFVFDQQKELVNLSFGIESMEDSFLNLAHFHTRRAENHLKYRRFDEAIDHHKKTVDFLNKAIEQCTIPKNIECLTLQRDYHEKYQNIVLMKKTQFLHEVMVQRERFKSTERENSLNKEMQGRTEIELSTTTEGDDEAFSPCCDDRHIIAELPPLELPKFDF